MNEMNRKKLYVWKLADFLCQHGMKMSGEDLADHLNRNNFLTSYGSEYEGGRGTYKLIKETYEWIHTGLGMEDEAGNIALAFVNKEGEYAWE